MISENLKQKIISILTAYNPVKISIFGSYARGDENMSSDLDILISFHQKISLLKLVQIQQKLSDELGIPVDLVTEKSVRNQHLKKSVFNDLVTIYS